MEGKTDFCHVYKSTSLGTYHGLVLDPSPQRFQLAGGPSTIAARSGSGKASKSRCFWIICQDLKSGQRPESDRGTVVLRVQPRASCSCPGAAVEVSSLVATLAHWWPPHNLLWTVPNMSGVALLSVWPPLALDHCFHSQFLSTEAHAEQSPWLCDCLGLSRGALQGVGPARSGSALLPGFQGFCPGKQQPCECPHQENLGVPIQPNSCWSMHL